MVKRGLSWLRLSAAMSILFFGHIFVADAGQITYEFTGIATGDLDGVGFTDAKFEFVLTGDTTNVQFSGGGIYTNTASSVSFAIEGVGNGTLLADYYVGANQSYAAVGFSRINDYDRVVLYFAFPLVNYDLKSAIGPIGPSKTSTFPYGFVGLFINDPTTAGPLTITNGGNVVFEAIVPEPSTFSLAGLGGLGLTFNAYRKRRLAA